jgi:hypothetical protein
MNGGMTYFTCIRGPSLIWGLQERGHRPKNEGRHSSAQSMKGFLFEWWKVCSNDRTYSMQESSIKYRRKKT